VTRSEFPEGVAVVIGGSGGVGSAICEGLAEAGTDVVLTYHGNRGAAEEAAEKVRSHGQVARVEQLATTEFDGVKAFFDRVVEECGRIHTIVNATGSNIPMQFIAKVEPETWRKVIDNDVNGFFNVVHASLPHLRKEGGSYVTVTSVGLQRWPDRDVLSVAPKAAIDALMTGIAREEGRYGIRANSVALGVIEAGIFLRLKEKKAFDEKWVEAALRNTALKRFGTPRDVADAVVFLASNRAQYVTGETITLDGGFRL